MLIGGADGEREALARKKLIINIHEGGGLRVLRQVSGMHNIFIIIRAVEKMSMNTKSCKGT